jgi:hypothetical protein
MMVTGEEPYQADNVPVPVNDRQNVAGLLFDTSSDFIKPTYYHRSVLIF